MNVLDFLAATDALETLAARRADDKDALEEAFELAETYAANDGAQRLKQWAVSAYELDPLLTDTASMFSPLRDQRVGEV